MIDENRDKIIGFAKDIYTQAELGHKKFKTADQFSEFMKIKKL